MHVRRGDYVANSKANSIHGSLTVEYYERAAEKFRGKKIYVFSDDIDWCEANQIPERCGAARQYAIRDNVFYVNVF